MVAATETRPRYRAEDLRELTAGVLRFFGVPEEDAAMGAEVLVDADLAGIESHGIAHLPWHRGYAPGYKMGIVNPRPKVKVLRESPTTAAWDADAGLGVIVARKAMEACIAKAAVSGIGMVTVANGRHFGAAGYYARMAAEQEMIGMAMCNVPPIAYAAGGMERVYGTNPIAIGAPVENDSPFLLDIATTAVAGGKLEIAMRQGKPIPAGWAMDAEGNDTADPEILRKGGGLLPLGSRMETSSYKGFGLGMAVDMFSGVLSAASSGLFIDRPTLSQGYWFSAWRIDAFRDPGEFKAEMKRVVDTVRGGKPAAGVDEVMMPGDKEARARVDRLANGVPLDAETIEQLAELAKECGVAMPQPR